jgi:hypothetical protein
LFYFVEKKTKHFVSLLLAGSLLIEGGKSKDKIALSDNNLLIDCCFNCLLGMAYCSIVYALQQQLSSENCRLGLI